MKSPCIGHCKLSEDDYMCWGCMRSIDEIKKWQSLTDIQQEEIINNIKEFHKKCERSGYYYCSCGKMNNIHEDCIECGIKYIDLKTKRDNKLY